MKDFFDSLDEIEDDDILKMSQKDKLKKQQLEQQRLNRIELEEQRLRKQALLETLYDGSNSNNKSFRYDMQDEEDLYDDQDDYDDYDRRSGRGSYDRKARRDTYDRSRNRGPRDDKYSKKHRQKKKSKGLKKFILAICFILAILFVIMFIKYKYLDADTSVKVETNSSTGLKYTNIALFGLDSRQGELDAGVRSDSIIIASINNFSHKINMVSVLRDTFVDIGDGDYSKINAAFSKGGAKQATETLNRNLDLDIKNYMVINFEALIKAVDAVGGIDLDMTSEEVYWLNGYQVETALTCDMLKDYQDLPVIDGVQHVNGLQATAYCRVRYVGTDVARTNRQRIVLQALITQAKKNPLKLNKMVNEMFPHISTNMSYFEFSRLGLFAPFYSFDKSDSFPYDRKPTDRVSGYSGSYVVADDFASNVKKLHKSLFNTDHELSSSTQNISENITFITSN